MDISSDEGSLNMSGGFKMMPLKVKKKEETGVTGDPLLETVKS
jgi:hypothetical protein